MSHLSVDLPISAEAYNSIILDHNATEQAEAIHLKERYITSLAKLLDSFGLSKYIELHLLHRHFDLEEHEVIMHRNLSIPGVDGRPDLTVDIAKAVPLPFLKSTLVPVLWKASRAGVLTSYEYTASEGDGWRMSEIPVKVW